MKEELLLKLAGLQKRESRTSRGDPALAWLLEASSCGGRGCLFLLSALANLSQGSMGLAAWCMSGHLSLMPPGPLCGFMDMHGCPAIFYHLCTPGPAAQLAPLCHLVLLQPRSSPPQSGVVDQRQCDLNFNTALSPSRHAVTPAPTHSINMVCWPRVSSIFNNFPNLMGGKKGHFIVLLICISMPAQDCCHLFVDLHFCL